MPVTVYPPTPDQPSTSQATSLFPYGEMARRHMERYRPTQYAALVAQGQEVLMAYFQEIDQTTTDAVEAWMVAYRETNPPPTDFMAGVAYLNTARALAEEVILPTLVLLLAESDDIENAAQP
jgi:hypothetical protein